MKKLHRLFMMLMLAMLTVACSSDDDATPEPGPTTDITAHFDAKFAAKLQEKAYIPDAKKILFSDVIDITHVDVSGTDEAIGELTSLAGIEYFKSLTNLNCSKNQLTILDVSKNTALTYLNCDYNKLTTLDVGKNSVLTNLNCYDNQLATLDVSKNTALTNLNYAFNQLATLDVSNNTALTYLSCHNNQLTTLDVSKNTVLTFLDCSNNQFTALDISKNTALTWLYCDANKLTTLDISKNTALTRLDCSGNPGIESTFVVKSWFDNNSRPSSNFSYGSWDYDGRNIAIDYQKVKL